MPLIFACALASASSVPTFAIDRSVYNYCRAYIYHTICCCRSRSTSSLPSIQYERADIVRVHTRVLWPHVELTTNAIARIPLPESSRKCFASNFRHRCAVVGIFKVTSFVLLKFAVKIQKIACGRSIEGICVPIHCKSNICLK